MTEESKPDENLKEQIKESAEESDVVSTKEADRAGSVAQKTANVDPVLINDLNQEKWWQAGVGVFGAGGVLWSIGTLLTQVAQHGIEYETYNFGLVVSALGSLASFVMILYRRYASGLYPLFWKWGE